jgi:hypothetical protein
MSNYDYYQNSPRVKDRYHFPPIAPSSTLQLTVGHSVPNFVRATNKNEVEKSGKK